MSILCCWLFTKKSTVCTGHCHIAARSADHALFQHFLQHCRIWYKPVDNQCVQKQGCLNLNRTRVSCTKGCSPLETIHVKIIAGGGVGDLPSYRCRVLITEGLFRQNFSVDANEGQDYLDLYRIFHSALTEGGGVTKDMDSKSRIRNLSFWLGLE